MTLQLHDLAKQDLFLAEDFYEQQEPGLGNYFSESLEADLERLLELHSDHELNFTPKKYQGYLVSRSRNFPWSIYYQCQNPHLNVQAILDQRFSPTRIKAILITRQPS